MDSRSQFNQLEISSRNENQESDNVESDIEYNMSENSVMLNMITSRILTSILIVIFLGILSVTFYLVSGQTNRCAEYAIDYYCEGTDIR